MQMPANDRDWAKYAAGSKAIETFVHDGMRVGLGSGTTAHWFVRVLGERVHAGLTIACATTSNGTRDLARAVGITVLDIDEVDELDITFDGADEIDPRGNMIKGGGGCHLWEKIVACASRRMVALVDEAKRVETLGAFPLPVEVARFGWKQTRRHLTVLAAERGCPGQRIELRGGTEKPFITDSGNYILDCHLGRIDDCKELAAALEAVPGVVEHGLFVGIAKAMVVGRPDRSAEVVEF